MCLLVGELSYMYMWIVLYMMHVHVMFVCEGRTLG